MDFKKLSQEEAFEQAREEGLKLPEDAAIEAKNKKKAEKAAKKTRRLESPQGSASRQPRRFHRRAQQGHP